MYTWFNIGVGIIDSNIRMHPRRSHVTYSFFPHPFFHSLVPHNAYSGYLFNYYILHDAQFVLKWLCLM